MSNIIPFDTAKLPAHIKAKKVFNAFAAAVSGGFKILSIKSKVFTVVDGDTKTLIRSRDVDGNETDAPAPNLEVVIVGVNPHRSKIYYSKGYSEGDATKPDCYSNDGEAPAADAQTPQAKKCATCAMNVWGSKISENGKKVKACSDSMRIAVAPAGQLNDPMLLRVPATSLAALGSFGNDLANRGVEPHDVVTKIGFDYTVSHPALTFKPVGFLSPEGVAEVAETMASDTVKQIVGTGSVPFESPVESTPAAPAKAEEAPAPKPAAEKPAPKPAPKPAAEKPKPAPVVEAAPEEEVAEAVGELVGSVDDLDFDD
jgi:hypothetical protein